MAYETPDLKTLIARVQGDVEAGLPGSYARPRRNLLNVLSTAQAGLSRDQHSHLAWVARQVVPDKADEAEFLEHCDFWGLWQKPAVAAGGVVSLNGQAGTQLQKGSQWQRPDGKLFTTTEDYILTGTNDRVTVTATEGGLDGNTPAGATLTLMAPVAGLDGQATVVDGLTGGVAQETIDAMRGRLRQRLRHPPHGGADFDYERWAMEVPGVSRAWCLPRYFGAGTVGVCVATDDPVDPRPDASVIQAVAAWIEGHQNPVTGEWEGRPTGATVSVFAPRLKPLNPAIRLLPDTPAIRLKVENELAALMVRASRPGATLLLTDLAEAVKLGATDYVLESPTGNTATDPDEMVTVGAVTWRS
ncbi:baseplate J/gp47 family protein [Kistimonas scapharcae]|uniref:Baseplate J/gp47 family protein n=2 Tax=Kistimonas scapharcae TaxID=1036133 RepID=A0ABP8V716_9GAMM